MKIRRATAADAGTARRLWDAFTDEATFTPYPAAPFDEALLRDQVALLAEEEGEAVGAVYANLSGPSFAYVFGLYVRPERRRRGVARALMQAIVEFAVEEGRGHVVLSVDTPNAAARAFYERLGFADAARTLRAEAAGLVERLSRPGGGGSSFGSIHVQTDDQGAVERAVREFVPRLPGGSRGSVVAPPRNGWTAVYDDVCDRDPRRLRRLAQELSDRVGAVVLAFGVEEGAVVRFVLLERGRVMDEYLSVQEFHGPLPPGDVIALAANPTVVARLTGADPARVRAAARHGSSPDELPPVRELLAGIAGAVGIEGAAHGYADAPEVPGATRIDRD